MKMPVISNETRLIGGAMRHGRRMNRISRTDAARALNSLMYHGLRNKCRKN